MAKILAPHQQQGPDAREFEAAFRMLYEACRDRNHECAPGTPGRRAYERAMERAGAMLQAHAKYQKPRESEAP